MNTYLKLFATTTALVLASCGPRDVAQEGNSSVTANGGKPVVVTNPGDRAATCPAKFTDEMSLRSPVESDSKVFSGKITASLGAGDRNCFRIGAVVNLQNGKQGPVRGQVTVTKVEILALNSLSSAQAQALGLDENTMSAFANEEVEKAKATFNPKGMVNVTYFTFNKGTQTGEAGGGDTVSTVDITTIDTEGERPATCPADFKNSNRLIVAESQNADVFAKKVTAVMDAGDRNCFKIGTEVSLHNSKEGSPVGKVKVEKVQIVPVDKLNKDHAKALGIDEKNLKTAANEKIAAVKFDALGLVHITYFTLLDGSDTGSAPTPPDTLPTIDEAKYVALMPALKEQISQKLSASLHIHGVEWDPNTLTVSYARVVTLTFKKLEITTNKNSPIPDTGFVSETGSYPAFRVSFKTAKGSPLALYNVVDGKEALLVMDTDIADNESVDIEGNILSKQSLWSSLEQDLPARDIQLINETSGKAPGIALGSAFKPLLIDVTPQ